MYTYHIDQQSPLWVFTLGHWLPTESIFALPCLEHSVMRGNIFGHHTGSEGAPGI